VKCLTVYEEFSSNFLINGERKAIIGVQTKTGGKLVQISLSGNITATVDVDSVPEIMQVFSIF
jgi:uncharacterized Zn-binding protein involved in type VI secretion